MLDNMMSKAAKIQGFRTVHSLRATTATRLYQAGVDKQLIVERTGHRSLDGVVATNEPATSREQHCLISVVPRTY